MNLRLSALDGRPSMTYLRLREGESARRVELLAGVAYADYDAGGQLLGVELLGLCEVDVPERAPADLPEGEGA